MRDNLLSFWHEFKGHKGSRLGGYPVPGTDTVSNFISPSLWARNSFNFVPPDWVWIKQCYLCKASLASRLMITVAFAPHCNNFLGFVYMTGIWSLFLTQPEPLQLWWELRVEQCGSPSTGSTSSPCYCSTTLPGCCGSSYRPSQSGLPQLPEVPWRTRLYWPGWSTVDLLAFTSLSYDNS